MQDFAELQQMHDVADRQRRIREIQEAKGGMEVVICTKLHERMPDYFDELGNYRPWELSIEDGYKVSLFSKLSKARFVED